MLGRGRLLNPIIAVIRRLDTTTTESTSGYDSRFRSVKTSYPAGPEKERVRARVELPEIRLKCQVEVFDVDKMQQGPAGNVSQHRMILVFHFKDLEAANLVDATGKALLHVTDRLAELRNNKCGQGLIRAFNDPQLFATESRGQAYGFGYQRNLLLVTFEDRPQGLPRAPA